MFSVIIPLYNKEDSIATTIQSVLDQTCIDFEIVVVNDGSTDKSVDEVMKLNDSRIRIVNKENGGVSSARNIGIIEAKFEWIAFLDGDDTWEIEKLECLNNTILNYPELNWIVHAFATQNGKKVIRNIYDRTGVLKNVIDDLLNGLKIHTSSITIKKKMFENDSRLFFREGVNNSEDIEVWYKISCLFPKMYYLDKVLSKYIIDKTSSSLTQIQRKKTESFHTLDLESRVGNVFEDTDEKNVHKIRMFIKRFIRKDIVGYWSRFNNIPETFQQHISPRLFFILNISAKLPRINKKVILKLIILISKNY